MALGLEVKKKLFGFIDGQPVTLFTVKNNNGFEVACINYGCIITKLLAPDRDGNIENIVLGFDCIEPYVSNTHFLGAVVGRFAGRIQNGKFSLEGQDYQVRPNDNQHHLHGGQKGFSHVLWDAQVMEQEHEVTIAFSYVSPDGEEGYPGNLKMNVHYTISRNHNKLVIDYSGISDKTTVLNVTNHTYFNLSGNLKRDILDHELTMNSDYFLELDDELLPTGECVAVDHSVFDFRKGRKVREGVASNHPQTILAAKGYDHPFLLPKGQESEIVVVDHESGRKLVVETTEPMVVLYTGNKLDGPDSITGVKLRNYLGLCLETQRPPDSLRHPHFPSSIIQAGEAYQAQTTYSFGLID